MSGAKTEQPTSARLRRAQAEGNNGASAYLAQALAIVVAVSVLPSTVEAIRGRLESDLHRAIAGASLREHALAESSEGIAKEVALLAGPLLACVAAATVASFLVQTGATWGRRPRAGALTSSSAGARVFQAARALVGVGIVLWIAAFALRDGLPDVVRATDRIAYVVPTAGRLARALGWKAAVAGLAVAAIDLVVTRAAWQRGLRMSRDEVKREKRELEGDSLAKAALDRARAEGTARGALASMSLATLVVWDGGDTACALRYVPGDAAPLVLVSGTGAAAGALLRRAADLGVPVRESLVARGLAETSAGEAIAEAFYDVVADLLRDPAPKG